MLSPRLAQQSSNRRDRVSSSINPSSVKAAKSKFSSVPIVVAVRLCVSFVEKIDDDDIAFLTIPMASPNALLDSLRIPRKIVIDNEIAELKIDSFRRRFGCNHNDSRISKMFDDRRSHIGSW